MTGEPDQPTDNESGRLIDIAATSLGIREAASLAANPRAAAESGDSQMHARLWRLAMWGKKAGSGLDDRSFLQPERLMSAIGGLKPGHPGGDRLQQPRDRGRAVGADRQRGPEGGRTGRDGRIGREVLGGP
ncbi:molybdenum cofactor biosynthesis protein MoeA [Streptomyces hygroscopicus]|nr:molybdenum cofactor biosynthesis protein MoeA [Streptomyces hygroscopicus]